MTEHETALDALAKAKRVLSDIWTDTHDDELFRAIRRALHRMDEIGNEIGKLAEEKAEREKN